MTTTEIIGLAIFALVIIIATWQLGFAFGHDAGHIAGRAAERKLANRRVNGVLDYENQRKPRKRLVYRKVDPKSVGKKRYLNSKLVGTILGDGRVAV